MKYSIGLAFLTITIIYSIILNILFFCKKHIDTKETRIFGVIVSINLIGIILESLCIITLNILGTDNFFTILVNRSFLVYFLVFLLVFMNYVINVAELEKQDKKEIDYKIIKYARILSYILFIFSTIGALFLKMDLFCKNGITYSYGPSVNLVYLMGAICTIGVIIYVIINFKNIKTTRNIPIIGFLVLVIALTVIQQQHPEITIATSLETVLIFLMYHTIENPDLKMVQQLELAKEEADKANAAKTDFLSSMSHEIRTPLNAIVGFSDLVSEAKTLEEAKTNARDIVNASQTLLEIVNGILDISKIEAGKLEIKESPYNARETFEDLAKLIKPRMDERGLDFSYFIAPDIPGTLYGDHANIKKIVTNFLSNAAKYTEHGYVKYEVNCINANGICKLIVSVEDSGRGIKKESINKLFEKFDRLDVERNTTVEGTGLGLAITKQLVEMMGGKIIVHTVYGEGSKFTVMLDQKIEKDEVIEQEKVSDNLNLTGISILLVDDNDLNIKVGSKLLEKFNADKIDTAKNGFECIDKVKANTYDLILLDDMMPKKSGTETLKELKVLPNFNTPVIALTANAIAGMRESYLAAGFDEYLAKPIEKQDLIKAVNKLLKDKLSTVPVEESTHVVEHAYPTNATEVPTDETNTVIDNNNIPIPVEPTTESDEEFLRSHGVDMDKALELLGDMEMYNMTMEDFSNELENKWSKLEQEKLSNDMENYAIDVHSLKSDCKYLGFYDLADVAYEHELKSKENDSTFVNDNFERLANEYLKVLNIVKEYKDRLK